MGGQRPVRSWLLGFAGAVLAGVVVGLVVDQLTRPSGQAAASDEGWGDLSAALMGVAAGVLVCTVAWLVLLLAYVRRLLAPASRRAATGAALGAVLACAVVLAAVGAVLASAGDGAVGATHTGAVLGAVLGAGLGAGAAPPVLVTRFRRRDGA